MPPLQDSLKQRTEFPFPARDPHGGIPLGSGTFGAMVWGGGRTLRITINRADYWDHRGGLAFSDEATFANLRQWLEAGEGDRIRAVFEGGDGDAIRPTRLPMGRVELHFPDEWDIAGGGLYLHNGEAEVDLICRRRHDQLAAKLRLILLRDVPVLCLRLTGLDGESVRVVNKPPDAPEVLDELRRRGYPRPQPFDLGEIGGWVQERPDEPALCVGWLRHPSQGGMLLYVAAEYGDGPGSARDNALAHLEGVNRRGYAPASLKVFGDWQRWWQRGPRLTIPDAGIEKLFQMGLYRLGGLSTPGGPAATLQGPWVEDHRMPPWSGDFHFNVNLQECYWPCFAANHLDALDPLVEMLDSWRPRLRENARAFVGIGDGLMLPHATDDRCQAIGGFWSGFVDHGSTAWVAHLLWLRYRFSLDVDFLRRTAYPFMHGAMRVYEAMLDREGDRWSLPVSVSPEFRGAGLDAWGRNASFQLALIHWLCDALLEASELLDRDLQDRARWESIRQGLPLASIGPGPELLLWEGQALTESHRHHSHLAGLYPFDIFDPTANEQHRTLIRNSLRRLTRMGMGQWTGWCYPWAVILHARNGNGDTCAALLDLFQRAFVGPGFATTHDARIPGLTTFDSRPDVMQIEAGLGVVAAILEMLLHTSGGVLRVFPAVPGEWGDVAFEQVRAEGALLVSATREAGETRQVTLRSEAGYHARVANPWGDGPVVVRRDGEPARHLRGRILEIPTVAGDVLTLERPR